MGFQQETIIRNGFGYIPVPEVWNLNNELKELKENLKKKKKIVKEVLTKWSPSRNNYRLLDFECLRTEFEDIVLTSSEKYIIFKIPKEIVPFLTSPETYARVSRSLISEAIKKEDIELINQLIPTNKAVLERRMKREILLRKYFGGLITQ